ncbi:MAG: DUF4906 domain-containing protein [Bacteroidales bacterium]|nr:DUF4906 domain-containing protein [Candidatus Cryptobacteroides equifaecalis]
MNKRFFESTIISRLALCASLMSLCLSSCVREEAASDGLSGSVEVQYLIAGAEPYGDESKSVLAEIEDQKIHDAILAFYDENGIIQAECDASRNGTVLLDANKTYDVYFVANMYMHGKHVHAAFDESDMLSWTYRMDGQQGREKITDIADHGIPMAWSLKGWKPSQGVIRVAPCKLFSKLALTIDKGNLVGSQTVVEILNLKVRSNVVLKPFETAVAAQSSADMTETGIDYAGGTIASGDDDMRFVVYVPENMQGNLNGGNSASVDKRPSLEREPMCSRVTCKAKVAAPNLSVDADYQFYIGKDASQNYDLERNCLYDVTMTLDPEHIFNPTWQVNPSITADSRSIALCHPVSGEQLQEVDQVLAVRVNRPARFRLKVNGLDALEAVNVNPDNRSAKLDKAYWSSDAYCPDKSKATVFQTLTDNGITLTMDPSTGVFKAEVTDPTKFVPGKDIEARFWLMPDRKKEVNVIFRTLEPMSFSMDTRNFYFGMKREVILSGFCGNVKLKSKPGDDYQLRIRNTEPVVGDEYFITEDGVQGTGNCVSVYAYYYADSYTLTVTSDDELNDSGFEPSKTFDILKPVLKMERPVLFVPIDGEARDPKPYYSTSSGTRIPDEDFDAQVYEQCLKPAYTISYSKPAYSECLTVGSVGSTYGPYICKMPEKATFPTTAFKLADVRLKSKVGGIECANIGEIRTAYPHWDNNRIPFEDFTSTYFNTYKNDGTWPTVEGTKVKMFLEECTHTEFLPTSGYLHNIRGSRIAIKGDRTHGVSLTNACDVFFEYAPRARDLVDSGQAGDPLEAPYGPLTFSFNIRNIHSGETFGEMPGGQGLVGKSFSLSYVADEVAYLAAKAHQTDADMYYGSPLSIMYAKEIYGTTLDEAFHMHPVTKGFFIDPNTGLYDTFASTMPFSGWTSIIAGAFYYGAQTSHSWNEFRDVAWTRYLCETKIPEYNRGALSSTYGWPKSMSFYGGDPSGPGTLLPDIYYNLHAYPNLDIYFTLTISHMPKIIDWEFME